MMTGLKKAAVASTLVFFIHGSQDTKRFALFMLVAAVVPPPAGIVTGLVAVGFYEGAKALRRSFIKAQGYSLEEDLEALGHVNESYSRGRQKALLIPLPQKTVSPSFEIR